MRQRKWAVAGGCLITFTFTGKIFSSGTQLMVFSEESNAEKLDL